MLYVIPDSAKLKSQSLPKSPKIWYNRSIRKAEKQHRKGEEENAEIEIVTSNARLITPSGLSLVGQVLGKSDLIKKANRMRTEKRSQPQIKNGDILLILNTI